MANLEIDYIEFQSKGLDASKRFLAAAFGWNFTDYGPLYASFHGAGINGGLAESDARPEKSPLIVLKANNLDAARDAVVAAGGEIVTPAYDFPGGRRFHFREPGGNEMAVWAER